MRSNLVKILGFKCIGCAKEHGLDPNLIQYICPTCGGNLQVSYDYPKIKKQLTRKALDANRDKSIWRYLDCLPVKTKESAPNLRVGWTPLYQAHHLGDELGLSRLFLKDESSNPSASFKDRASAVVIGHAVERGVKLITGASTGNAASSTACLSARAGIKTVIFVPDTAPQAKITQLLVFGATVIAVRGTYDQAFDLCLETTKHYGWYNRNTGYNPITREGKKTCAFELIEQLGWKIPDVVLVPTGDGNILSGLWKGFCDFERLGLIEKLPRLIAVQAEKSAAIFNAFEKGGKLKPVSGDTIADSISVSMPRDGEAALVAIRESGGFAMTVSDDEILGAIPWLGRREGIFAEPAAAAAVAGLKKATEQGRIKKNELVVALITGSGLKDIVNAMKSVGKQILIKPTMESVHDTVKKLRISS